LYFDGGESDYWLCGETKEIMVNDYRHTTGSATPPTGAWENDTGTGSFVITAG